jgi:hypothetical protein
MCLGDSEILKDFQKRACEAALLWKTPIEEPKI